jgi:serralysin
MAQVSTNISNISVADNAYSNFYSQSSNTLASLESYLGNIDSLTVVGNATRTDSVIAGTLSNGDSFSFNGSRLQSDIKTINSFEYRSTQGIVLSASGALSVTESSGAVSGRFNNITVQDNRSGANITYSYSGSFTFTNFTTSNLNISTSGFSLGVSGNLIEDEFGNQSGVINSLLITVNGQTTNLQNLNLEYSNFDNISSYSNLLASALSGNDNITGSSGNDTLAGYAGDDFIDGGAGTDTALFNFNQSDITFIRKSKIGNTITIGSNSEGADTLSNIESVQFSDGSTVSIDALISTISSLPVPAFSFISNGVATTGTVTVYTGPVSFLEYQSFGNASNEVVVGSRNNDFINLFGGDDAADGGDGDDVLDGGTGSNFLVGGIGNDTFFLDGRGGTITWSTITDFSSEEVNIWGWVEGVSKLLLTDANGGVDGFRGATFHYDLNNDGTIDTSITFSGLSFSNVPTATAGIVADNGYLLIA